MYALMIWTIVGFAHTNVAVYEKYDWRLLTETSSYNYHRDHRDHSAKEACEMVAKELNLKPNTYRCVKIK